MCDFDQILDDLEVLEVITVSKEVSDESAVTVLEWGTSTLGGEVTGFLGEHLKLSIKAKIVRKEVFILTIEK